MKPLLYAALFCFAAPAAAASFSYHGSLQDNGKPAEGKYDLQLTLYSAAQGGKVVGGPITLFAVPVHNGSFNTEADFGPLANVQNAWLGVDLRTAGSAEFSALGARAAVSATTTASVCPGAWTLAGNAGNPAGSYLGTADSNPLVFEVNGLQAGTLMPTTDPTLTNAPNVVFGSSGNSVTSGVGAIIAGGGTSYPGCGSSGASPCVNTITGNFATISGGDYNTAAAFSTISGGDGNSAGIAGAIGGGESNDASGRGSTISGGHMNTASGDYSTAGGGAGNMASGVESTVGGGNSNIASGVQSTVGGGGPLIGEEGVPGNTASGFGSTVSGGDGNTASGDESTVGGGESNVAGGRLSFAAGTYANVRSSDTGTFVWSDSTATQAAPFTSTGANQFLVNASGGVGIGMSNLATDGSTQAALNVTGFNTTRGTAMFCSPKGPNCSHIHFNVNGDWFIRSAQSAGQVVLQDSGGTVSIGNISSPSSTTILSVGGNAAKAGGGSWAVLSDARLKQNIADIAHPLDRILALHGVEFDYIPGSHALEASGRQIGFIAQDVEHVFPDWVGTGSDGYKFIAVHGFEALTVESMRQLREEKDVEIATLRDQLDQLTARIQRLEAAKEE